MLAGLRRASLDVLKVWNPYQMSQVSTTLFKTLAGAERGQETLLLARRSLDGLRRSLARRLERSESLPNESSFDHPFQDVSPARSAGKRRCY